jgi:transposase-like protein
VSPRVAYRPLLLFVPGGSSERTIEAVRQDCSAEKQESPPREDDPANLPGDTRAGEIELQIPKIRQGSYFPSILAPRRRSEQALLAVVQQVGPAIRSQRASDKMRLVW